jgi:protein tyrosine/serine phosphatase
MRGRIREACGVANRALAGVLVLSICGCAYFSKHTVEGACSADLNSPIRNFCVVTPHVLWRGEKPNGTGTAWLVDQGVGTVVDLELFLDDHSAFDEAPPSLDASVDYFHIPDFEPVHIVNWSLLDNHVAEFLAIMSEARKPVYVHCLDGIDRTNTFVAAYRVLIEGESQEKAIEEMARFHSPYQRFDAKYIEDLAGDRGTEILRKVQERKSRPEPSGRIVCKGGKCIYSSSNGAAAGG